MTTYLGVGAVRIQTWLAHTPKLTHLRGASQALQQHTSNARIQHWLDTGVPGARLVGAAGDVDGVIALELLPDVAAGSVATRLVADLHNSLPGVQWAAWWCEDVNYLKAMWRSTDPDDLMPRLDFLPALQDNPLAESCPQCRREPLTLSAASSADTGTDCLARDLAQQEEIEAAKRTGGRWDGIPGAWPKDFDELAARGGLAPHTAGPEAVGRRDSRSHLATIDADGNGLGGLVSAIAKCPVHLGELYENTVSVVNEVLLCSVITAAQHASDPASTVKGAIPHYAGGDDCLVTVPAAAAWVFAARLAEHFDQARVRLLGCLDSDVAKASAETPTAAEDVADVRERIGALSLGVGMVFAGTSHPFAETSAVAHQALNRAKVDAQGRSARIGWADLTAESGGVGGPDALATIEVSDVLHQLNPGATGVGTDVFSLSPSARSQLGSILRDSTVTDRVGRQSMVDRWAKRTDVTLSTSLDELPAALSRARWWPATNTEESDQ